MLQKVNYTEETKEQVIKDKTALGWKLLEDCHHFDGIYFLFDDGKKERDLAAEVDALKAEVEKLKAERRGTWLPRLMHSRLK